MIGATTLDLHSHLDHRDGSKSETRKSRRSQLVRVVQFVPRLLKITRATAHIAGFTPPTRGQNFTTLPQQPGNPFAELSRSSLSLTRGLSNTGAHLTAGRWFITRIGRPYL